MEIQCECAFKKVNIYHGQSPLRSCFFLQWVLQWNVVCDILTMYIIFCIKISKILK